MDINSISGAARQVATQALQTEQQNAQTLTNQIAESGQDGGAAQRAAPSDPNRGQTVDVTA